jgi:integrase/recombinase XerD
MFRNTFAVEMLLAGLLLEQTSILLGHKNAKIIEEHHAPWGQGAPGTARGNVREL